MSRSLRFFEEVTNCRSLSAVIVLTLEEICPQYERTRTGKPLVVQLSHQRQAG
jgi:hypothetical protein